MFETETTEKVTIETQKKPLIICGFLGVFWNICSGASQPVKAPTKDKTPPAAQKEPFCNRNTYTDAAAPEAEKKVLLENFEHLHAQGSIGASRKICYGTEDHLGSTRMVLDQNGTIKQALMYQPYGTIAPVVGIGTTASDPLRDKFTTQEFDEDGDANGAPGIQAYHFGARMYDPDIAVFLSTDRAGQYHNAYSYTGGNPVLLVDPDGNLAFWIPIAIGAAAGGLGGALADKDNPGIGFIKGSAIGALGGTLSNFGGGNLFQNMLWGGAEGAITGGLWAGAFGEDVGNGMWQGALGGMAGAALQSGVEIGRNALGGYGWHTNDYAFGKMVKASNLGNELIDPIKAQEALDFFAKRYKTPTLGFTYDEEGSSFDNFGRIGIASNFFAGGADQVKMTIAHEVGHYRYDITKSTSPEYGGDGRIGYREAFKQAGKYHYGIKTLTSEKVSSTHNAPYQRPAFKDFGWKYLPLAVPRRF